MADEFKIRDRDKQELIAAILAGGLIANGSVSTPDGALRLFSEIYNKVNDSGLHPDKNGES